MKNIMSKIIPLILIFSFLVLSGCNSLIDSSKKTHKDDKKDKKSDEHNVYNFSIEMPTDLYRGINVGNALDAPNEGDWGWVLKDEYFEIIKNAGFDHIRIPIRWSNHAGNNSPYTIDQTFFDRVDWAINNTLSRGMIAVIDMHHYNELFENPSAHKDRFIEIWRQISEHYKDYSENLYFEILNEPNTNLTPGLWNQYLMEVYNIIRLTNPTRYIVIDTALWGNYMGLDSLIIPENDPKIIVTFHYYVPWNFCFQGADWMNPVPPTGILWNGTIADKSQIINGLNYAVQWSKAHNNVILWNSEYCVHKWADFDSKIRWITFVTREAEKRGIANTIWSFHKSDSAGMYDPDTGKWIDEILNAVIPK